jgi:hypothetical protein
MPVSLTTSHRLPPAVLYLGYALHVARKALSFCSSMHVNSTNSRPEPWWLGSTSARNSTSCPESLRSGIQLQPVQLGKVCAAGRHNWNLSRSIKQDTPPRSPTVLLYVWCAACPAHVLWVLEGAVVQWSLHRIEGLEVALISVEETPRTSVHPVHVKKPLVQSTKLTCCTSATLATAS